MRPSIPGCEPGRPLFVAHRGASDRALENSPSAFSIAVADGADMIEFDVRLTSDGVPVVFHDDRTGRTGKANLDVAGTAAPRLRSVPLKNGEPIPTLVEVLDLVRGRIPLNVESKVPGAVAATANALAEARYGGAILLSSGLREECLAARSLLPGVPCGLVTRRPSMSDLAFCLRVLVTGNSVRDRRGRGGRAVQQVEAPREPEVLPPVLPAAARVAGLNRDVGRWRPEELRKHVGYGRRQRHPVGDGVVELHVDRTVLALSAGDRRSVGEDVAGVVDHLESDRDRSLARNRHPGLGGGRSGGQQPGKDPACRRGEASRLPAGAGHGSRPRPCACSDQGIDGLDECLAPPWRLEHALVVPFRFSERLTRRLLDHGEEHGCGGRRAEGGEGAERSPRQQTPKGNIQQRAVSGVRGLADGGQIIRGHGKGDILTLIDIDGVKGCEARAEAVRADGIIVSSADAMCLKDEPNWKAKPMFQLRSMAQTRACSKALRNVLSWVVVLAGSKPTPAEEMEGVYEPRASVAPTVPSEDAFQDESEEDIRTELVITLSEIAKATKRDPKEILKKATWGKDGRFATDDPNTLKYSQTTKTGKPWSRPNHMLHPGKSSRSMARLLFGMSGRIVR